MQTLSEHNTNYEEMLEKIRLKEEDLKMALLYKVKPAGVNCPMCKIKGQEVEMVYDAQGDWISRHIFEHHWSNPVKCPRCGYKHYKRDTHSWGTPRE